MRIWYILVQMNRMQDVNGSLTYDRECRETPCDARHAIHFCECRPGILVRNGLTRDNWFQYNGVTMSAMASQITSLTIVYSTVYLRRRSRKTPKLRVTGLCVGNSPLTSKFPGHMASNAENVSIWWRHHVLQWLTTVFGYQQNFHYRKIITDKYL